MDDQYPAYEIDDPKLFPSDHDFTPYQILILPQLWMLKQGVARRLEAFVEQRVILVATSYLGICDEINLCFNGGWPGDGLIRFFGLWNEEYGTLSEGEKIELKSVAADVCGLGERLMASVFCGILRDVEAEALRAFYHALIERLSLESAWAVRLPAGSTVLAVDGVLRQEAPRTEIADVSESERK